jgi:hypothetical protein
MVTNLMILGIALVVMAFIDDDHTWPWIIGGLFLMIGALTY